MNNACIIKGWSGEEALLLKSFTRGKLFFAFFAFCQDFMAIRLFFFFCLLHA